MRQASSPPHRVGLDPPPSSDDPLRSKRRSMRQASSYPHRVGLDPPLSSNDPLRCTRRRMRQASSFGGSRPTLCDGDALRRTPWRFDEREAPRAASVDAARRWRCAIATLVADLAPHIGWVSTHRFRAMTHFAASAGGCGKRLATPHRVGLDPPLSSDDPLGCKRRSMRQASSPHIGWVLTHRFRAMTRFAACAGGCGKRLALVGQDPPYGDGEVLRRELKRSAEGRATTGQDPPYDLRQAKKRSAQRSAACGALARFHTPAAYLFASLMVG